MDSNDLEKIITEEKERSRRLCEEALEETPEPYRKFITFITNRKKIGDTYVQVQNPYMTVAGRVQIAIDEHREREATLDIETWFEQEMVGGHILCKTKVVSSLLGSATAHARVFVDGSGASRTNHAEVAETSSIGRALGNLGYGLYGTGIASAEEMESALAAQAVQESRGQMYSSSGGSGGSQKPGVATAKQVEYAKNLLKRAGWSEAQIDKRVSGKTREDISGLIEHLKANPEGSKPPQNGSNESPTEEYEPAYSDEDVTF